MQTLCQGLSSAKIITTHWLEFFLEWDNGEKEAKKTAETEKFQEHFANHKIVVTRHK